MLNDLILAGNLSLKKDLDGTFMCPYASKEQTYLCFNLLGVSLLLLDFPRDKNYLKSPHQNTRKCDDTMLRKLGSVMDPNGSTKIFFGYGFGFGYGFCRYIFWDKPFFQWPTNIF
jgi:hypothetical protein